MAVRKEMERETFVGRQIKHVEVCELHSSELPVRK
jgi:hypothetical protein